jgi:hypothetical protein
MRLADAAAEVLLQYLIAGQVGHTCVACNPTLIRQAIYKDDNGVRPVCSAMSDTR